MLARSLLSLAALAVVASACASSSYALTPTERNPASTGEVVAKESKNGNTQLTLKLDHLPQAAMLDPSLTTYVAWVRPTDGARYTNIGQIAIDENRRGTLQTVTPYDDFFVVVTGEASATAPQPSQYVLLQGEVDEP